MSQATATVLGALILAAGLWIGSHQIAESVKGAAAGLDGIQAAVSQQAEALKAAATSAPRPAPPPAPPVARRGPDPNRQYTVPVGGAPVLGAEQAEVTIVAFSDFQCPFCQRVGPTLEKIRAAYGDRVRIAFKHLPLDFHTKAPAAHKAAIAAGRQGQFWEMHDKIFANQQLLAPERYAEWAAELGLDVERFERDMASEEVQQRLDADKLEAAKLGVTGTPSFFVNGYFLSGAQPFERFQVLIDKQLEGA